MFNFDALCICHLPPEVSVSSSKLWNSQLFRSRWVRNYSAGGRPKFKGMQMRWTFLVPHLHSSSSSSPLLSAPYFMSPYL